MPKKMEQMRKAIQRGGKSKASAYAIAQSAYKKYKAKRKRKSKRR